MRFRTTGRKISAIVSKNVTTSLHSDILRSVHNVTPLWCASVAGKYRVVDVLVKYVL